MIRRNYLCHYFCCIRCSCSSDPRRTSCESRKELQSALTIARQYMWHYSGSFSADISDRAFQFEYSWTSKFQSSFVRVFSVDESWRTYYPHFQSRYRPTNACWDCCWNRHDERLPLPSCVSNNPCTRYWCSRRCWWSFYSSTMFDVDMDWTVWRRCWM